MQMVTIIKANGKMAIELVKGTMNTKLAMFMKVNGEATSDMELVL